MTMPAHLKWGYCAKCGQWRQLLKPHLWCMGCDDEWARSQPAHPDNCRGCGTYRKG